MYCNGTSSPLATVALVSAAPQDFCGTKIRWHPNSICRLWQKVNEIQTFLPPVPHIWHTYALATRFGLEVFMGRGKHLEITFLHQGSVQTLHGPSGGHANEAWIINNRSKCQPLLCRVLVVFLGHENRTISTPGIGWFRCEDALRYEQSCIPAFGRLRVADSRGLIVPGACNYCATKFN